MNCSPEDWLEGVLLCSATWHQRAHSASGLDPAVTDTAEPGGGSLEKQLEARQVC